MFREDFGGKHIRTDGIIPERGCHACVMCEMGKSFGFTGMKVHHVVVMLLAALSLKEMRSGCFQTRTILFR